MDMVQLPDSESLLIVKHDDHVVSKLLYRGHKGGHVTDDAVLIIYLGMGFCEFDTKESCQSAIDGLNGYEVHGRQLRVDHARPRY